MSDSGGNGWLMFLKRFTLSAWASSDFMLLVTFFSSSSRSPHFLYLWKQVILYSFFHFKHVNTVEIIANNFRNHVGGSGLHALALKLRAHAPVTTTTFLLNSHADMLINLIHYSPKCAVMAHNHLLLCN